MNGIMRAIHKLIVVLFFLLSTAWASDIPVSWFTVTPDNQVTLRVDFFMSSTCPHCEKANIFLTDLESKLKWLKVNRHIINEDKAALVTFNEFLQAKKANDFTVPSLFFCDSRWIGFAENGSTGRHIINALNYCHEQIIKNGDITPETGKTLTQMASASWYESSISKDKMKSATSFTPMIAVTDALNSSSIFTIITLFSLLMVQRRGLTRIIFLTMFLLGTGIAHYLQQVYTPSFYQILPYLRVPVIFIGTILCLYSVGFYPKKTNNKKFSPIVAGLIILFSAMAIQLYEQTAIPNFSLMFQQWLTTQNFPESLELIYSIIYQLVYLTVIAFIALILLTFNNSFSNTNKQKFMQVFAWHFLLIIGLTLIIYPFLLANFIYFFVIMALTWISAWVSIKIQKRVE